MIRHIYQCFKIPKHAFSSIVPRDSRSSHLINATSANKLIKPQLKHLNPTSTGSFSKPTLNISHTCIPVGQDKYIIDIRLAAETKVVKPTVFVACLDVSESMCGSSSHNIGSEESKFSRWDLVKHSMNTTIHCLRPIDKLALVTFNNDASKVLPLMAMDEKGKREAIKILSGVHPGGGTNLWAGLDMTLEAIEGINDYDQNLFTLLLTDGEPNVNPVRGILQEFALRRASSPLYSTVHTFGYGYGLDSALLDNIATKGGGLYAHIPDHTMCNTVFINFLSNALATAINRVCVSEVSVHGGKLMNLNHSKLSFEHDLNHLLNNQTEPLNIGSIQSGLFKCHLLYLNT